MLAVAADNFTVSIVDTGGRKVVRRFRGHTNRITDMVRIKGFSLPFVQPFVHSSQV